MLLSISYLFYVEFVVRAYMNILFCLIVLIDDSRSFLFSENDWKGKIAYKKKKT